MPAISFCVFVMPILLGSKPDVKRNFEYLEGLARSKAAAAGDDSKTDSSNTDDGSYAQQLSEDEIDGAMILRLPEWAKSRLLDGILDIVNSWNNCFLKYHPSSKNYLLIVLYE